MPAPVLISYTEPASDWTTTGNTTLVTASISWQVGDVLVVIAGCESNIITFAAPTASGLTFNVQKSNNAASTCSSMVAAAVAGSSSSGTVTVTGNNGVHWGFGCWVWRGSNGIGASAEQHTSTKTVNLTLNSPVDGAVVWGVFDFAAAALQTITPTPDDTRQRQVVGTSYTIYVSDLKNQQTGGAVAYGISGTGSGPFSIVVMEILDGTAGWTSPTAGPSYAI